MSHPWEDPVANAIIEFARAVEKVAAALQTIGDAYKKDVNHEIDKDRPYSSEDD